jgi:hypothetical protein
MTNATKTLSVLFAVTLTLAAVTSWNWSGTSSAAFRTQLVPVDSSAVQAVRIDRGGMSVRLQRTGDGWRVGPQSDTSRYPARSSAVERLLRALHGLEVNAVATRQASKHPRYGVDSTATAVTLLDSDNAVRARLLVGRTEFRDRNASPQKQTPMQRMRQQGTSITYVRPPGQPDVYSVEASLEGLLNKPVDDWRDKTIWGVARADIQRVRLTTAGDSAAAASSVRLQRAVPSDTAAGPAPTWLSNGDTLSTDAVSSVLSTVASPRASGFAETTSPTDLTAPTHTVRLQLREGTTRTLRLYPNPSSADTYLATASDYPYVAQLQKRRWNDVFQPRSSFVE